VIKLYSGNNVVILKTFEANSIDTVITDPPYLLNFMNKKFDSQHKDLPGNNEGQKMQAWHTIWAKEVLRVIRPGGFMLAFGGSRTSHRLASALEDAGWELKDTVMFLFGVGFPKSTNIALNIQKVAQGHPQGSFDPTSPNHGNFKGGCSEENELGQGFGAGPGQFMKESGVGKREITEPGALPWVGHGTALKPAFEPIIVAMKPCDGTYVNNALVHGVAGLNINACRIGIGDSVSGGGNNFDTWRSGRSRADRPEQHSVQSEGHNLGRWPANVILSCICGTESHEQDCPVRMLDQQSGIKQSGKSKIVHKAYSGNSNTGFIRGVSSPGNQYDDKGGASRFFYCAKTSKKERGEGNSHPTVKPLALIEYLCKLTSTPTGGVILDPFAGSGSTLIAANNVSRDCIGIELEQDYCNIIRARLQEHNIQFEAQEQLSELW